MLAYPGKQRYKGNSPGDSVHNYYEHLVIDEMLCASSKAREDAEYLADAICIALNQLPPKYVRHDVDTAFSMTPQALATINDEVKSAVRYAVEYLTHNDKPASNVKAEDS